MHVGQSQFQTPEELFEDQRQMELDQHAQAEVERVAREAFQYLTEAQFLTREEALAVLAESLGPSTLVGMVVRRGWRARR